MVPSTTVFSSLGIAFHKQLPLNLMDRWP